MQPDPDALASDYYRAQATLSAVAATGVAGLMAQMSLDDIDAAWEQMRDQIVLLIATQQLGAALMAVAFFSALMRSQGLTPTPEATLDPMAFVGWTAAGISLPDVVDSTPVVMKVAIQAFVQAQVAPPGPPPAALLHAPPAHIPAGPPVPPGAPAGSPPEPAGKPPAQLALESATQRLARIAASEVQDAGRGMMEAQTRLEPQASGYIRKVTLPACGRCLLLAGRVYTKSTGFLRHPQDDCVMVPFFGDPPNLPDARDLFHQMTDVQQDKAFTRAGARAIRDNADPSAVVNARRGMDAPGHDYTRVKAPGTSRKRHAPPRLSPQGVARAAGDDTVAYRRLLRENGYIST